jgi:hypothetical protein
MQGDVIIISVNPELLAELAGYILDNNPRAIETGRILLVVRGANRASLQVRTPRGS